MIIKYEVGTSNVTQVPEAGKRFGYIDRCEDVNVEIFGMKDVLADFVKTVCAPEFLRDDWKTSVRAWAGSGVKEGERCESKEADLVYFNLVVLVKNMSRTGDCTKYGNLELLKTIAEWMVSKHVTSDNFWLNSAKLKIFTFKNGEEKIKYFLLDDVYLLNDNGKTIDIIK
mgnify:CR=1 FL=1